MPGSLLPLDPKNVSVSLTLSHEMLKAIISQSAKQSSVKVSFIHMAPPLSSLLKSSLPTSKYEKVEIKWVLEHSSRDKHKEMLWDTCFPLMVIMATSTSQATKSKWILVYIGEKERAGGTGGQTFSECLL